MKSSAQDHDDSARQTVRFYDAEAKSYEASRYERPAGRRVDAFHKRVLRELLFEQLTPSAQILELGCGTGRLLGHWRASHPEIYGIDASFGMLTAAGLEWKRGRVLQGSAYRLPFADASFDAVYSILVINLLEHYRLAFQEVSRLLRPGALFVFNVPNLQSLYFPGGLYVNLRQRTVGRNTAGFRYSHWFRQSEINSALAEAGMTPVRVAGQPPWVSWSENAAPLHGGLVARFMCKSLYFLARKHARTP